jgi:uncharacterized protein YcsI (UPF0317 family)
MTDLRTADGRAVRQAARSGALTSPTAGLARGFVQTNLAILPREQAFDFLLFCQRNPKPCPLIDVTEPGQWQPSVAADADLRTDVPGYCVYRHGELIDQLSEIGSYWRDDLVSFLIGCSFTFETALQEAGVPVRHIEQGRNVPMYRTSIACRPAGVFHGPLVVSMRPLRPADAIRATTISARQTRVHGAPVHIGDPAVIGIGDLARPDYGEAVDVLPGELPVFWACGVTPQAVAMASRPPLLITHRPGLMFLTDLRDRDVMEG